MKYTQQDTKGLERYIDLSCDIEINKNVYPTTACKIENYSVSQLIDIIGERIFNVRSQGRFDPTKYALIKTKINFKFKDENGKKAFESDPLYLEYTKFKDTITPDCEPVVLTHPAVLAEYLKVQPPKLLYNVDGMHRIMSACVAGIHEIDAFIIINRKYLHMFIPDKILNNIYTIGGKCDWFPRYQEIKEVNLKGQRTQEPRYTEIYDFSILKDKSVVDFGGNIGQAAIEAYFCGANKVVNLEYQKDAIETAKLIADALGIDIINSTIDFNDPSFENDVGDIVGERWDWTIFQAIYRTKEIKDIKKNFDFIVRNTKEGIIFEGNADSNIDTIDFYERIFKPYNFSSIKYLGKSQNRPAFIILK